MRGFPFPERRSTWTSIVERAMEGKERLRKGNTGMRNSIY